MSSAGSRWARATVAAHASRNAAQPVRMLSGSETRSTVRNGYHGSCSLTNDVTSTPLTTSRSTKASISTLTSHACEIATSVRFTSLNRAPRRSAPQNTAPVRSPSNSSGTPGSLPPTNSSVTTVGRRELFGSCDAAGDAISTKEPDSNAKATKSLARPTSTRLHFRTCTANSTTSTSTVTSSSFSSFDCTRHLCSELGSARSSGRDCLTSHGVELRRRRRTTAQLTTVQTGNLGRATMPGSTPGLPECKLHEARWFNWPAPTGKVGSETSTRPWGRPTL